MVQLQDGGTLHLPLRDRCERLLQVPERLQLYAEINPRLPIAGTTKTAAYETNTNRSPNVGIFDVRLEKEFVINPRWARVTGMLDIFNLFNNGVVTNARNTSGSRYKEDHRATRSASDTVRHPLDVLASG